jgi:hypothetical protein
VKVFGQGNVAEKKLFPKKTLIGRQNHKNSIIAPKKASAFAPGKIFSQV